MLNVVIIEGGGEWLSWGCKVYAWFHLSEPLFRPLSCLGTCWLEISLQFSLETTLMSHTNLAHQYFTSKPNLLRMTTYHKTRYVLHSSNLHIQCIFNLRTPTQTHKCTLHVCTHKLLCIFLVLYFIRGVVLPRNTLAIPLKYFKSHTVPGPVFSNDSENVARSGQYFANVVYKL